MRRLAVALAGLAAAWGTPVASQTDMKADTKDRDVSCLAVMAFAAAALDNPEEDAPLRIYFAYYLGRLNARDPNERWAERGITMLKAMTPDQLKAALLTCASIADHDFQNALQPTADGR